LSATHRKEEFTTYKHYLVEDRNELCSCREAREIVDIVTERRESFGKFVALFNKFSINNLLLKGGDGSCCSDDSTEATDLSSLSYSSWESQHSILISAIIEDPGILPVLDEVEENEPENAIIRFGEVCTTPRITRDFFENREDAICGYHDPCTSMKAKSLVKQLVLKNKIEKFFRSTTIPWGIRLGDGWIDMTYSSFSEKSSCPLEIPLVNDGRARLRELYGKDVEKMRQQQFLTANRYRSTRHARDQLNRMALKPKNIVERRMKAAPDPMTQLERGGVLACMGDGIPALTELSKSPLSRQCQSRLRQNMEECTNSNRSESNASGLISSEKTADSNTVLPFLSEESAEDFYMQASGMMRTMSFCEAD
jgi:hypothetical protein